MDGHECSEVFLSEMLKNGRMDAEYYAKEYIYETEQLLKRDHFNIGKHYKVTDGEHGSVEYLDEGVKYLTAENIKKGYVDLSKIRYVSEDVDKRNARASVREGDILISIKGTLGQIAVATSELVPCNMNRDVAIIKPLFPNTKSNYFLALFMMGKYGALQSQRGGSGGVQQMITLGRLREFIIPKFQDELYDIVKDAYEQFLNLMKQSKNCLEEAEEFLLSELNFDLNSMSTNAITIKTLSESFGKAQRIDAEYYQPKYDDYEKHVREYVGGFTTPRKEFDLIKTKCLKDLPEYRYIEIGDIEIGSGRAYYDIVQTEDLPANAKIMTKKGDLLVSTVRPYRGAVSILQEDDFLVSGAFTVLRSKTDYPAQTLQVLFRTRFYKDWFLKFNCGTSYPVIKDDDVLDIPIPIFEDGIHSKISEYVIHSQKLLGMASGLLDSAKAAVEMAIEIDEIKAKKWLEEKLVEFSE